MVLFVDQYVADLLGHCVLAQGFTLANTLPIVANRFVLVFQVEAKHVFCFLGSLDQLWRHVRHPAQIVNLLGED